MVWRIIIDLFIGLALNMGCVGPDYVPDLETWEGPSYRGIEGRPDALPALAEMFEELEGLGLHPIVISGYRSYEQQAQLHEQDPKWTEPPGCSQHQRGTAFDLGWWGYWGYELPTSRNERLWEALRVLTPDYGFEIPYDGTGDIPAEPWHLNYIGETYALDRRDSTSLNLPQ